MNLSSFDVGFLIATIFGKLKLPPKVDLRSEIKDHKFCILDTQDLYSGNTRSGICILETQDLYSGNTRSAFRVHKTKT